MTPAELLAYNPAFDDDYDTAAFGTDHDDMLIEGEIVPDAQNIENLILLTSRLAQLLAEEADLLAAMKISSLEGLQEEKAALTEALDAQRKFLERSPQLLTAMDEVDRQRLEEVLHLFDGIMRENHRRLLVAREVNKKVVEAISASVYEANSNFYNKKGAASAAYSSFSLSLDERI